MPGLCRYRLSVTAQWADSMVWEFVCARSVTERIVP